MHTFKFLYHHMFNNSSINYLTKIVICIRIIIHTRIHSHCLTPVIRQVNLSATSSYILWYCVTLRFALEHFCISGLMLERRITNAWSWLQLPVHMWELWRLEFLTHESIQCLQSGGHTQSTDILSKHWVVSRPLYFWFSSLLMHLGQRGRWCICLCQGTCVGIQVDFLALEWNLAQWGSSGHVGSELSRWMLPVCLCVCNPASLSLWSTF